MPSVLQEKHRISETYIHHASVKEVLIDHSQSDMSIEAIQNFMQH